MATENLAGELATLCHTLGSMLDFLSIPQSLNKANIILIIPFYTGDTRLREES